MTTRFFVEYKDYIDLAGFRTGFFQKAMTETLDEAIVEAGKLPKHDGRHIGDWRIVKRTMDEATFTTTEEVVKEYNYWKDGK